MVSTPIGNLEDITLRALRLIREADFIIAEDTRVTRKLLSRFDIRGKKLVSFHSKSPDFRIRDILGLLKDGKSAALLTDAGTPGISDPGARLIAAALLRFGAGYKIIPVPGPSAVTAALSVSGFPADRFVFLGFPPRKKGREKFFSRLSKIKETIVFFESTHRILKTMDALVRYVPDRQIMAGRELTKIHESIYRGQPLDVTEMLKNDTIKGEFVIVICGL